MGDKIRGALFNILGDIDGLTVLDAFAGTGALSFEAVSRGARKTTTIEQDRTAQKTITANIQKLDLIADVQVINASASAWLQTTEDLFDIVLCDPPHDELQVALVQRLAARAKPNGIVVLCWPKDEEPPILDGLTQIERRSYGDAQLIFFRAEAS
jgi:16S rRNA (guanine(966)-N(2))-methyltransferase RsmD